MNTEHIKTALAYLQQAEEADDVDYIEKVCNFSVYYNPLAKTLIKEHNAELPLIESLKDALHKTQNGPLKEYLTNGIQSPLVKEFKEKKGDISRRLEFYKFMDQL